MTEPLKIAVYGKGGIGKSVVATNLSMIYARKKQAVLHVGCDPKHDSAVRLMPPDGRIKTVLEVLGEDPVASSTEQVIHTGRLGIHCCESGGPRPGLGCGGRGVARTLEFLDEMEIIERGGYQVLVFDVLGDVVCGGFAAPLRQGFADKVVIVTSEEPMAMYAANNISRAISVYEKNGVVLAGLVANLRGAGDGIEMLEALAREMSTRVLAVIPRDPKILEGERKRMTVVEYAPGAPSSKAFMQLAEAISAIDAQTVPLPTPMEDEDFYKFLEKW
jgi:nitrogenase iron protein NifH